MELSIHAGSLCAPLTSLALFIFAAVITNLFVEDMVSWFMFINSAMVIF